MVETLSQVFLNTVKTYVKDDLLAAKVDGRYVPISTEEFARRVKHLSLGLADLGLGAGDKLVIFSENRPEWTITDFAVLCAGAVTVPIYTSLMPEQVKYIINDSDAKIVVCSNRTLWLKVEAVRHELPNVHHFVLIEEAGPQGVVSLSEVMGRGKVIAAADPGLFEKRALAVKPGDLASIIYTSGTTGVPKGVMLTHANFVANSKALDAVTEFSVKDTILSFLPLSHVLERMTTFSWIYKGASIYHAESIETVAENLLEVRPTIMISVPRLFDKIYAKVMDNILAASPAQAEDLLLGHRRRQEIRGEEDPPPAHSLGTGPAAEDRGQARLRQDHREDGRPGPLLRLRRRARSRPTWPSSSTPSASPSSRATA